MIFKTSPRPNHQTVFNTYSPNSRLQILLNTFSPQTSRKISFNIFSIHPSLQIIFNTFSPHTDYDEDSTKNGDPEDFEKQSDFRKHDLNDSPGMVNSTEVADPDDVEAQDNDTAHEGPPRWSPFVGSVGGGLDMADINGMRMGTSSSYEMPQSSPLYSTQFQQQQRQNFQQHLQNQQHALQDPQFCFQSMSSAAASTSGTVRTSPMDPLLSQSQEIPEPEGLTTYDQQSFLPFPAAASFSPAGMPADKSILANSGIPGMGLNRERGMARGPGEEPGRNPSRVVGEVSSTIRPFGEMYGRQAAIGGGMTGDGTADSGESELVTVPTGE